MKIRCLGGFREVGRSAVLFEDKEKILMDYGLKVESGEIPEKVPFNIDGILLSHPHLDHSGMIPNMYHNQFCQTFSTISSFDQSHLLLKDSMKIAKLKNFPQRFSLRDIEKMQRHEARITFGQQFEIGNTLIDVLDSGHIPGGCGFLLDSGKRIFYTSDFKSSPTRLLNAARFDVKDIDVLITESTYAFREHPPRKELEDKLHEIIRETINNDGIALLPCFAVGRSAEILMLLDEFRKEFPIFLDGMAREATEIALRYPEFLRDHKALKKALEDVVPLYTAEDRNMALKRPCAIVSTAGLLEGGPAVWFLKKLYDKPNCSLVFTGFQIPNTAGRMVLDTGRYRNEGLDLKIKMNVKYLEFSAHADRPELLELVKNTNPKKVICMHGDKCEEFAQEIRKDFGVDALAPKNGDVVELD